MRAHSWLCWWLVVASLTACSGYRPGGIRAFSKGISKVLLFSEARDDAFSAREDAQRRLQALESLDGVYVPSMGLESAIYTTAEIRALTANEYSLVFDSFPGLYELAKSGKWPKAKSMAPMQALARDESGAWIEEEGQDDSGSETEFLNAESDTGLGEALAFQAQKPVSLQDVELALTKFRKIVGGLEKYRITNPLLVANHYRDMARFCLGLDNDGGEGWGSAAAALEYAGFMIRSHVDIVAIDSDSVALEIPYMSLESMWTQAAVRLLDLEFSSQISAEAEDAKTKSVDETFDQRFFAQMQLDEEGVGAVQDMLLSILRISLLAVLSKDGTQYAVVDVPPMTASLGDWAPPLSAVKTVLTLGFKVLEEDETEEAVRFFVANKSSPIPSAQPGGIFDGL